LLPLPLLLQLLLLQVRALNNSEHTVMAFVFIDGQKLDARTVKPHSEYTFTGVAVASNPKERKELLFSLPRFVTQAEQKRAGGKALTQKQTAALGTIRLASAICMTQWLAVICCCTHHRQYVRCCLTGCYCTSDMALLRFIRAH
jgi:hypothetical protein